MRCPNQISNSQRLDARSEGYLLDASVLEKRLLFSGTPIDPQLIEPVDGDINNGGPEIVDVAASATMDTFQGSRGIQVDREQSQRLELVFVDSGVEDHQQLIDELRAGDETTDLEIFLLDGSRDGVAQITEILAGFENVDAIHVLSHGNDGTIRLGNVSLGFGTLDGYAADLATWRSSLTDDADLLIYGCEFAETETGIAMMEAIAELTGADVAASVDDTGHQSLGGDWELERTTGLVEAATVLNQYSNSNWQGVLSNSEILATGETLVNETTTGTQTSTAGSTSVAVDAMGNSVVVWVDQSGSGGNGWDIYARRYNTQGDAISSEFLVNNTVAGDQSRPVVAMDASGRFVVAWVSNDGSGDGIFLRRFEADGTAIDTNDILVNAGKTDGDQNDFDLATNDSGQIVIAFRHEGSGDGIRARTFDFDSATSGDELTSSIKQVDSSSSAAGVSVDINNSGSIIVVWEDTGNLYGRSYDFVGLTETSTSYDINVAIANESQIDVALRADDDYVIAYRSDVLGAEGIWTRYIPSTGPTVGILATNVSGDSTAVSPKIDMDPAGNFVISYERSDASSTGVYVQAYTDNMVKFGAESRINETTTGVQTAASIAIHDYRNGVVVWNGNGNQAGQVDTAGVFMRQFGTAAPNTAPTATNLNQVKNYTEDDPTVALDDIVITDPDTGQSIKATLTLDLPTTGVLTTGTFGASTSTYDSASGVWAVVGTVGDVNAALAAVAFTPASNNVTDSKISVQIVDSVGTGPAAGEIQLVVTAQNDAPEIDLDGNDSSGQSGADFAVTFVESGPAILIVDGTDSILSDVDSPNLASLTVTITNLLDGAAETLTADTSGTAITANYVSGVLTLSGSDTVANYKQVLRTIRYDNASGSPNSTTRTITFLANDGALNSNLATAFVSITSVNNTPVIDLDGDNSSGATGSNFNSTFVEGGGAILVVDAADASLTDVDSLSLTSLTVTITNRLDGTDELLSADTSGTGITAVYSGGVLSLTGTDSVANYQQVLRSIRYDNASDMPNTTTRLIRFVANDGGSSSNLATASINVLASNDAPTLDLDANDSSGASGANFDTVFIQGDGAVRIVDASDAVLLDIDNTNLSSLTVTITNLFDGAAEVLSADTTGTGISASYLGGTLTLFGVDSTANYQQVLRSIRYNNLASVPNTTARMIQFVANDGASNSNVATASVAITAANNPPTLDLDANNSSGAAGTSFNTTFSEGGGAVLVIDAADAVISDVDNATLASLTVNISNRVDGALETLTADTTGTGITASFTAGTLTLSGVDSVANYQQVLRTIRYDNSATSPDGTTRVIRFIANDGVSNSNIATANVAVNVTPVNNTPVAIADKFTMLPDETLTVGPGGLLSNDYDIEGETLTVVPVTAASSGTLTLGADGSFQFTPMAAFSGFVTFSYAVTDGNTTSAAVTVVIEVTTPISPADIQSASTDPEPEAVVEEETVEENEEEQTQEDAPILESIIPQADPEAPVVFSGRGVISVGDDQIQTASVMPQRLAELTDGAEESEGTIQSSGLQNITGSHQRSSQQSRSVAIVMGMPKFDSSLLWNDIEELQEGFQDGYDSPFVFAGTFAGFSGALSVGYVMWTVRGGLLATSLLAHLPAWSFVDPLLVLNELDDDEDGDDDSLENMLSKNDPDGEAETPMQEEPESSNSGATV